MSGRECRECGDVIRWGRIETHGPGAPNSRSGDCGCGADSWLDEDRGGWGHYTYAATAPDEARERRCRETAAQYYMECSARLRARALAEDAGEAS